MTHDELLAYINKEIDQAAWTKEYYPFKSLQALRAVVEILKSNEKGNLVEINQEFNLGLTAMAEVIKQAIEKGLG